MSNSEGPGLWLRTDDATAHGVSSYQRAQNIPLISNCYQYQPLAGQRSSSFSTDQGEKATCCGGSGFGKNGTSL